MRAGVAAAAASGNGAVRRLTGLLRYIDDEPGADQVELILAGCISGSSQSRISAVQWAGIAGKLRSHHGPRQQNRVLSRLPPQIEIVTVTPEMAVRAAELRVDRKISYGDAFALELALGVPEPVLVTADYAFKAVADLVSIEFLPVN
ncbi:MAG TPA: PIN domain-containing protein [Terracidiphilus sp.]